MSSAKEEVVVVRPRDEVRFGSKVAYVVGQWQHEPGVVVEVATGSCFGVPFNEHELCTPDGKIVSGFADSVNAEAIAEAQARHLRREGFIGEDPEDERGCASELLHIIFEAWEGGRQAGDEVGHADRDVATPTGERFDSAPAASDPQVTNYDAEAEAMAHDQVVHAADSFGLYHDTIHKDVGKSRPAKTNRTPDGRPVSGFREQESYEELRQRCYNAEERSKEWCEAVGDLKHRITELERERDELLSGCKRWEAAFNETCRKRDEARAERDLLKITPHESLQHAGWVKLDDDTIELAGHECGEDAAAWLRNLRRRGR